MNKTSCRLLLVLWLASLPLCPVAEELDDIDKAMAEDLGSLEDQAAQGLEAKDESLCLLLDQSGWQQPLETSDNLLQSQTDLGAVLPAGETEGWAVYKARGERFLLKGRFASCELSFEIGDEESGWKPILAEEVAVGRLLAITPPAGSPDSSLLRVTIARKPKGVLACLQGLVAAEGEVLAESGIRSLQVGVPKQWDLVSSFPAVNTGGNETKPAELAWKFGMRAAGTEQGCRNSTWVPLDRTQLDKWILGSPRFFQFRVAARGDFAQPAYPLRSRDPNI